MHRYLRRLKTEVKQEISYSHLLLYNNEVAGFASVLLLVNKDKSQPQCMVDLLP